MATTAHVRRQQAAARKDMERDLRKKARAQLVALRDQLKAARQRRRARLREVTSSCRTAQREISARAKRARARLSESVKRTREQARGVCSASRGAAHVETLDRITAALDALDTERRHQAELRRWARPRKAAAAAPVGRARARERRQEDDDEVAANIDDPGLRIVWEHVKHTIKPKPHATRTEVFAEWAAAHPARVYEIQEADAERHLLELERQERELSKRLAKRKPFTAADLEAVPF